MQVILISTGLVSVMIDLEDRFYVDDMNWYKDSKFMTNDSYKL